MSSCAIQSSYSFEKDLKDSINLEWDFWTRTNWKKTAYQQRWSISKTCWIYIGRNILKTGSRMTWKKIKTIYSPNYLTRLTIRDKQMFASTCGSSLKKKTSKAPCSWMFPFQKPSQREQWQQVWDRYILSWRALAFSCAQRASLYYL